MESMVDEQYKKEIKEHNEFLMMITPIFSNLLKGVKTISDEMRQIQRAIPALDLIKEILDILK